MNQSVILSSPLTLAAFAAAALLSAFDLKERASGYVFPLLSAALFSFGMTYALLLGAPMQEALIVALIFFALNLKSYKDGARR